MTYVVLLLCISLIGVLPVLFWRPLRRFAAAWTLIFSASTGAVALVGLYANFSRSWTAVLVGALALVGICNGAVMIGDARRQRREQQSQGDMRLEG